MSQQQKDKREYIVKFIHHKKIDLMNIPPMIPKLERQNAEAYPFRYRDFITNMKVILFRKPIDENFMIYKLLKKYKRLSTDIIIRINLFIFDIDFVMYDKYLRRYLK